MILDPADLSASQRYKLLISAIVPRPIAWVSTTSREGNLNLAPFSYFTGVCNDPMTLLFCPVVPRENGTKKDTLANIEETGEFVVNIPDEATAVAMNISAAPLSPEESEFALARVKAAKSICIRPPRVAEAPIAFECRLQHLHTVSPNESGGFVVFGEVVHIHVLDRIWDRGSDAVSKERFRSVGRMGGSYYATTREVFALQRMTVAPDGELVDRAHDTQVQELLETLRR